MVQAVRPDRCVVAVDGPSGSGKSTVSRRLATAIDGIYLDTGAMYRAITWAVLQAGVDLQDADSIVKVAQETSLAIGTDPTAPHFRANDEDVDAAIRGPEVTGAVSAVAAVPGVRRMLVRLQQEIIAGAPRIVVEGRDIASVVAPDADLKVYLTASAAERARRRSTEQSTDLDTTAADMARRDRLDSTRTVDPLAQAPDAVVLDSTELGIDEVVARLVSLLDRR